MPNATADPTTEQLKQLIREMEAVQPPPGQEPPSNGQAQAIANTAREIDIASMALDDDLFNDAPTPTARLTRLNQIRRQSGLAELNSLPTELESPGFIANLKKEYPKALLRFLESDAAQAIGAGTESTSIGLARAIARGEQPAQPPEGAGFKIMSSIISLLADPVTYASGGLGGIAAKGIAKKVGTGIAGRVAARGATTGTTLAGLTAVRDPLGQQATTGEIDPVQTGFETLKAGLLGAAAGGAGAIGGKVVGTGLEIGTFATGGAALEARLPTADDFIESAGVILGLRVAGVVQRRLGTALFKRSRSEQLTPEEQQAVDQTPQTVKERILLDVKETPATAEQTFTKEKLLSRQGAQEFSVLHPDTAKALVDAPTASRKNFEPLKRLLPDVGKEMNAAERNQLRAYLHEVAGKPVVPTDLAEPGAPTPPAGRPPSAPTPGTQARSPKSLTAEPMPEPGAKLDKLQETVVNNAQAKATAETSPESVPVVPVEATAGAKRRGLNPVKKLYRWLTTGGQHEDVVRTKTESDALLGSILRQMRFSIDNYNRGIRKEYGILGRVPEQEMAKIRAVLNERALPETLPESVRGPVLKMRSDMDALSSELIRSGVIQGEMEAIFTGNLGTYLRRSYRIFRTDPKRVHKFINKLAPDVKNKAIALFRGELEESLGRPPTPAESEAYLASFLYSSAKKGSAIGAATSARMGVKELGILKQKKDIPPEIRALWGEDANPRTQYATTVASQARLLASAKQLQDIRQRGLGKWLFEQPQGEFIAKIDEPVGDTLYPLTRGKPLFTTPEYEQAMRSAFAPASSNAFIKTYFWLNAAVKAGKTAGSVMGIQRNFLSNPLIALANGHINPWRALQAARTTGTDILPSVFSFLKLSNRAQQEQVQKLIKLKVMNASSRSGELRAIFKDASRESGPSGYIESTALRALTLTPRKFFDFFRGGDDFYHINGFYHELASLKRAYPELPLESLEAKAASKVVRTYPTYSEAPHAIQAMRKAVVVGDFVTFPAEMVRTTINIPRLIAEELANPKERAIGIRRAMGFATMGATVAGIATATRQLAGVSKKEEEAMRDLAPDWMRNSQWAHLGKVEGKKHEWRTIDTQYNMPQSFMVSPVIAALRGEPLLNPTQGALEEILRPFFNETILFGVARDIGSNQRISDGSTASIYNPEASPADQTAAISGFITGKLQPGTFRSIDRISKGLSNKPLKSGLVPDPEAEIIATLLGLRVWTHDVPRALGFQTSSLMDRRRDARGIFFEVAYARDGRDEGEIQDAYDKAVDAEREIFDRMQHIVHSAKVLGLTDNDVKNVLSDKRVAVSKGDAERIIGGTYDENNLLSSMVWSLSGREFDERIPRILKALGVSGSEAQSFLIGEMRDRGYKTVPVMRIARLRKRID